MEGDVSDRTFLEQLHELQHKLHFVKAQEFKEAKAVEDVQPVLESLKFKVGENLSIFETHFLQKPIFLRSMFFFKMYFSIPFLQIIVV